MEDLRSALIAASVNQAKGSFDGNRQSYQIGANDQLLSSAQLCAPGDRLPQRRAGQAHGRRRREDGVENVRQAAWMNQTPAVIMNIQRQPGANIISVVDRIKSLLPQLTATLPKQVQVGILTDRTNTIRASVADVQFELMLTVGLVVMVIFLFLRNVSATIIPSIAVPLSLVGTFGVMYMLGYSLNNLTLMALTISTGFVVDDAIVMIENITRYIEEGETPLQAALHGLRTDRLHDYLADHLADRGADSAAVHGRYRRPAVPRIRRHAERDDSDVRRRVADADADDVLQAAAAQAGRASRGGSIAASERAFNSVIAFLRQDTAIRVAVPDRDAAGRGRDIRADRSPLHR